MEVEPTKGGTACVCGTPSASFSAPILEILEQDLAQVLGFGFAEGDPPAHFFPARCPFPDIEPGRTAVVGDPVHLFGPAFGAGGKGAQFVGDFIAEVGFVSVHG